MFVCNKCFKEIEDCDIEYYEEEKYDFPYPKHIEYYMKDCDCGGFFVPAKKCKTCKKYIEEDDFDICEDCTKQNETLDNALSIGNENADSFLLNEFWSTVFDKAEIESILLKVFRSYKKEEQEKIIHDYLNEDKFYFTEWVVRKGCKNN